MLHVLLLAAAVAAASPATAAPTSTLYRVELAGGQLSWAIGKPQPNGALLLFRHYPDGALMSVRSRDVKRIVEKLKAPDAVNRPRTSGYSAPGDTTRQSEPVIATR